ncbi:hypothetical protein CO058_01270 [candidate division WWE3 bacterium CG_4_9_14_0_2_um_filter_35_11]|uniref:Solute-binding protein family 5 domain-containing protein n=1 Tax=candidate division WWE3 bacterium CG_4_9_14_0_2_um_filter_35_11 TaxID=1975077 RepID=A0A2M8EMB2_UNCKA|nr:MAG: hypothetical protein COV25_03090 [candidate division WWE3 bacterium CG10_big_fil_rev_8_21_14_0_10_35_32]PJC23871.1 MAG: hypothetical protein CO058_01270 [candidate division WWE3 bacterium CG_4_9_14_0_2_um_filter_35_11]
MLLSAIKVLLLNIFLALATLIPQTTLSVGMVGQPVSFLPHNATTDSEKLVSQMVFRSLFKYQDGELKTDLLSSWSVSDDLTAYDFKLKKDAAWQDGTQITSNDIIYTLSLYENLINEMEIEKVSPQEVQIKLSNPTSMLPSIMTFGIEPAHLPNQSKLQPIGSTSYQILFVQKEGNSVQKVILQSFSGNKQYNRLSVSFYKSENDQQTGYKLGEINAFLSNSDITLTGANKIGLTYLGRYFVLLFNTRQTALEPVENRKVLESALNTEDHLKQHYYENAILAKGPLGETFAGKVTLFEPAYNPKASLTTSQSSVLTKLSILLPNNNDGRQIESLLKSSWEKELGINLEIEFLSLEDIVTRGQKGEYDVLFIGHETSPDPDRYAFWHSTQIDKLNFSGFTDLRADKALEEGRKTFDEAERIKHYSIFQDVLSTKVPAVFLYHQGSYLYISKKTDINLPKVIYYPSDILKNL